MDFEWKLGEDLCEKDCIFDPITFDDIILALHCGEREIDEAAARKVYREILTQRREDAMFLLDRNMSEILRLAKVGRAEYENND